MVLQTYPSDTVLTSLPLKRMKQRQDWVVREQQWSKSGVFAGAPI